MHIIFANKGGCIICGFAGCGKSTLAKQRKGIVDLESTPFNKDWETYVRVANHMKNNGYIVLMSCHKELREELHRQGIEYYVAMPRLYDKSVYMYRYKERGNSKEFIDLMDKNFMEFTKVFEWEQSNIIELVRNDYLSEFIM